MGFSFIFPLVAYTTRRMAGRSVSIIRYSNKSSTVIWIRVLKHMEGLRRCTEQSKQEARNPYHNYWKYFSNHRWMSKTCVRRWKGSLIAPFSTAQSHTALCRRANSNNATDISRQERDLELRNESHSKRNGFLFKLKAAWFYGQWMRKCFRSRSTAKHDC